MSQVPTVLKSDRSVFDKMLPVDDNVLMRNRKMVALLSSPYVCLVTIDVLWLFLMVPWVGLQCVIVVFADHTHLLFCRHILR